MSFPQRCLLWALTSCIITSRYYIYFNALVIICANGGKSKTSVRHRLRDCSCIRKGDQGVWIYSKCTILQCHYGSVRTAAFQECYVYMGFPNAMYFYSYIEFPIPGVTYCHKSGGLNQHNFIILQFWRTEVQKWVFGGQKSKCGQVCILSGGCRENLFLLFSSFQRLPTILGYNLYLCCLSSFSDSDPAISSS